MTDKIMKKPSKVVVHWKYGDKTGEFIDTQPFVLWNEEYKIWSTFWWDEGNGGCDCNRSNSFGLGDFPCGHTIEIEDIVITE